MQERLKNILHFHFARYFLFFAGIKLWRWKPRVMVVTGSSGKTTLLHLVEAQLKDRAYYSHKANSPYGIAFNILGLKRKTLKPSEWFGLIIKTPFLAFSKIPKEKIYIVEADCDRPKEGRIISDFLKPEVTLLTGVTKTHAENFDSLVPDKFRNVLEAISHEYGYYFEITSKLVLVNGDQEHVKKELTRAKTKIKLVTKKENLKEYQPGRETTRFVLASGEVILPALVPEEVFYSIELTRHLVEYLEFEFDTRFSVFKIPPGRSTAFSGIKNTILVDSTYNSNLGSAKAILNMFSQMPGNEKWAVMADMLELGSETKREHELLAQAIIESGVKKVFLYGELCTGYTLPVLKEAGIEVYAYLDRQGLLSSLVNQVKGGESILFKGSQSCQLDAVLEKLLENPEDSRLLPRQEKMWKKRRKDMKLKI